MPDTNDSSAGATDFFEFLEGVTPQDFVTFDDFEHFTQNHVVEAVQAFERAGDGPVGVLIYLRDHGGDELRVLPEDENFQELFLRIREVAIEFKAEMLFMALVLRAANRPLDIDATDPEQIAAAFERGDLQMHYGYYAEAKTGGLHRQVSGVWPITDNGELGEVVVGLPSNAPFFHQVLP